MFNIFDGHCPEQLSSIRDFEGAPGGVKTDALSADAMLDNTALKNLSAATSAATRWQLAH